MQRAIDKVNRDVKQQEDDLKVTQQEAQDNYYAPNRILFLQPSSSFCPCLYLGGQEVSILPF